MAAAHYNLYMAGDPANPDADVELNYDDVTGAIASIDVVVNVGHLTVTITNPPKQPNVQVFDAPAARTFNIPSGQGYTLTKGRLGDWQWTGTLQISFHWEP